MSVSDQTNDVFLFSNRLLYNYHFTFFVRFKQIDKEKLFYVTDRSDVSFKPFLSPSYVLTALLGGAAAGLGSSLSAVPGGQPSAPNLNPPSQIDPSSIERAYAALGLTYQGNQIQTQTAQPNMSNQALQGQAGMRPLNPMGKLAHVCLLHSTGTCIRCSVVSFRGTCQGASNATGF